MHAGPYLSEDDARAHEAPLAASAKRTADSIEYAEQAEALLELPAWKRGIEGLRQAVFAQFEELAAENGPEAEMAVQRLRWTLQTLKSLEAQFKIAASGKQADIHRMITIDEQRTFIDRFLNRYRGEAA